VASGANLPAAVGVPDSRRRQGLAAPRLGGGGEAHTKSDPWCMEKRLTEEGEVSVAVTLTSARRRLLGDLDRTRGKKGWEEVLQD
jgi:hypothetical protein